MLFGGWGVGENSNKKVGRRVIADKMEICSYLQEGKIFIHRMFPVGWMI